MRTKLKKFGEGFAFILAFFMVFFGMAFAQELAVPNAGTDANPNQNLAGSKVELSEGFEEQYKEFLKKQAPSPSFDEKGKLVEVYPPYLAPMSLFNIDISGEQIFRAGEKIALKGSVKYENRSKEIEKNTVEACQSFGKDNKTCDKVYSLSEMPILNSLGIYVQVFRVDNDPAGSQKGDYLVDEFYTLENFSLRNGEKKNFNLVWKVPTGIPEGEYYFLLYLDKDRKFPLLGTPLVAFSEGKRFDFEVQGAKETTVEFNKNSILLNGRSYAHRSPAPTVPAETITIAVSLLSSLSADRTVKVNWEVYRWGQTNPEDLIQNKEETVIIPPGGQTKLNFAFTPSGIDSVYSVKARIIDPDYFSAVNVRFVLEGRNRGIFRFVDLVKNADSYAPLVCIRNANWQGDFKGQVRVSLNNKTLTKEGGVRGTDEHCYLAKDPNFKVKNPSCYTLFAEVLNERGEPVDSLKSAATDCSERASGAGEGI